MTGTDTLIRFAGLTLLVAGLLYVPLPFIEGWAGIADIGGRNWWVVYHMATIHHFFLLFGLFGLFAAQLHAAGSLGIVAFVLAALGNAMVAGVGMVQTTVLPALAAHPEGQGALDCTPFYTPATRAAQGFTESACADWHFEALAAWVGASWLTLVIGAIALGVSIFIAGVLPRLAGLLIAFSYLAMLAAMLLPLPEAAGAYAIAAAGIGYVWCGWALWRRAP